MTSRYVSKVWKGKDRSRISRCCRDNFIDLNKRLGMKRISFVFTIIMTARERQTIIQIKASDVKAPPPKKKALVSSTICKQLKKIFNNPSIIIWTYIMTTETVI
jgi:hypothetical protein